MMSTSQRFDIKPCTVVLPPLRWDLCSSISPCRIALSPLKEIKKQSPKKQTKSRRQIDHSRSTSQRFDIKPCTVVLSPLRWDLCSSISPCRIALSPLKEINKQRPKKHQTKSIGQIDIIDLQSEFEEMCAAGKKSERKLQKLKRAKKFQSSLRRRDRSTRSNSFLCDKYLSKQSFGLSDEDSEVSDSESESSQFKKREMKGIGKKLKSRQEKIKREENFENLRRSVRPTKSNALLCEEYLSKKSMGLLESERTDDENESMSSDSSYESKSKRRVKHVKIVPEPKSDYEIMLEKKKQEKFAFLQTLNFI